MRKARQTAVLVVLPLVETVEYSYFGDVFLERCSSLTTTQSS
jgi:hypothetical protein